MYSSFFSFHSVSILGFQYCYLPASLLPGLVVRRGQLGAGAAAGQGGSGVEGIGRTCDDVREKKIEAKKKALWVQYLIY